MKPDFSKGNGLLPAIVQDADTGQVLMLGYQNKEAWEQTLAQGKVTFFSRSKGRLWTKGESSGHHLLVQEVLLDCDQDTVLILASPQGPTCHTGQASCFGTPPARGFLHALERKQGARLAAPQGQGYTRRLHDAGLPAMAQKVGEEAVEVVVAALAQDKERLLDESADLMYHLLLLLRAKGCSLDEVEEVLRRRGSVTA